MSTEGDIGLIVANGNLPSPEIVASLLADNPYVLAADGGADKLLELGVIPQAVLGDFDSMSDNLPSSIVRIYRPDQNYTDLDKAVIYLRDEGYTTIWVIGASGDRLDHTFGALSVLVKHGRDVTIALIDDVGTAQLVSHRTKFDATIGQKVSLLPLGEVELITTTGLKWNLNQDTLQSGVRDGISNEAISEEVTVELATGDLIIYIHHDYNLTHYRHAQDNN